MIYYAARLYRGGQYACFGVYQSRIVLTTAIVAGNPMLMTYNQQGGREDLGHPGHPMR